MSTALVRYHPAMNGALFRLRGMLIDLEKTVRGLEREYASDVDKLRQFERRFRPAVGDRYDELERLRERINRGWQALGEAREGRTIRPGPNPEEDSGETVSSPRPEEGARQLFLRLARQIHPDLAADEEERRRRHELMAEATLAYRDNDDRRLQWLLEHWQAESEPILGFGLGASWARTNRQIAWTRYRVRELQYALGQLHASPVARMMQEHEQARSAGRNFILEMRRQLHADLEDAYRELDRLESAVDDLAPEVGAAVRSAFSA